MQAHRQRNKSNANLTSHHSSITFVLSEFIAYAFCENAQKSGYKYGNKLICNFRWYLYIALLPLPLPLLLAASKILSFENIHDIQPLL